MSDVEIKVEKVERWLVTVDAMAKSGCSYGVGLFETAEEAGECADDWVEILTLSPEESEENE